MSDDGSTESSDSIVVPSPDELKAMLYYHGLPSRPRLVARTSTTPWIRNGEEAWARRKEITVVVDHQLNDRTTWEQNIAPKVLARLDDMGILWTSTDVVRIGFAREGPEEVASIILWIGVRPQTLTCEDGTTAAYRCRDVLREFGITDVEVEIRESTVIRSAGPMFLSPWSPACYGEQSDPTAEVRIPLTYAAGFSIAAEATPSVGSTAGFFMAEGDDSDGLLLITTRHPLLPPIQDQNITFEYKNDSQSRVNVLLFSNKAYEECIESIQTAFRDHGYTLNRFEQIAAREQGNDEAAVKRREAAKANVQAEKEAMKTLLSLQNDIRKKWVSSANRVLGHVVYSPPICLGAGTAADKYTEDYAIIKVDKGKINMTEFIGNVLYLGTSTEKRKFSSSMYRDLGSYPDCFDYFHGLLTIQGTIPDEDMKKQVLTVLKNGSASGLTRGYASGIKSFIRQYPGDGVVPGDSCEWAILSPPYEYQLNSIPFSAPGDSGAVIVDVLGRIAGLLTGGAGSTDRLDITYGTPIGFIEKSIKAKYPNAHSQTGVGIVDSY